MGGRRGEVRNRRPQDHRMGRKGQGWGKRWQRDEEREKSPDARSARNLSALEHPNRTAFMTKLYMVPRVTMRTNPEINWDRIRDQRRNGGRDGGSASAVQRARGNQSTCPGAAARRTTDGQGARRAESNELRRTCFDCIPFLDVLSVSSNCSICGQGEGSAARRTPQSDGRRASHTIRGRRLRRKEGVSPLQAARVPR